MMIHFCDHQMSPNDICYFVHSKCFTCSIRAILKMFPYRFMAEISHSRWWFHFVIIKCPQMTYATLYIQTCSWRAILEIFPYRLLVEISHSRWQFHFVIIKCPQMTSATLYIQSITSLFYLFIKGYFRNVSL